MSPSIPLTSFSLFRSKGRYLLAALVADLTLGLPLCFVALLMYQRK